MNLVRVSVFVFLLSSGLAFYAWNAWGHDDYPPDCCASTHCHPVDCKEITMNDMGDLVWQDIIFAPDKWRTSHDGRCHVCVAAGTPLCIMPGGSV